MSRETKADKRQLYVGLAIMLGSICMLFAYGSYFNVFGTDIQLSLKDFGFCFWIILGMFGMGYVAGGIRGGLKFAASLSLLMLLAGAWGFIMHRHH